MKTILLEAIQATTAYVQQRQATDLNRFRKEISRELFLKQYARTEKDLTTTLTIYFKKQIQAAKRELNRIATEKNYSDTAENITNLIFTPEDWYDELVNRALPVLARGMGEAGLGFLLSIGIDPRNKNTQATTKTTATEWIGRNTDFELPPGIAFDLPRWMYEDLGTLLRESFEQDYWKKIPFSTRDDIRVYINHGVAEGWSLQRIAAEITQEFPSAYSKQRAMLVARTESAHALNGARNACFLKVKNSLGEAGKQLKKEWMSVLSSTTRDSHANLDGTLENQDGLFFLGGVAIPWPGHYALPAADRCNCQCTLSTSFGDIEDLQNLEAVLSD